MLEDDLSLFEGADPAFARRLREAVESLIANADRVTVSTVAERVGVSRFALARQLRRTGVSAGAVIRHERLRRAKNLLAQTAEPTKSVAYRCGFGSFRTFARHFKAAFGVTPSVFRARTK